MAIKYDNLIESKGDGGIRSWMIWASTIQFAKDQGSPMAFLN